MSRRLASPIETAAYAMLTADAERCNSLKIAQASRVCRFRPQRL